MEVTTTTTLNLNIHKEEFELKFSWSKKQGVDKNHWFTPSGKSKIWIGVLSNQIVGKVKPKVYNELLKQLKENKTELFKWRNSYYTVSGGYSITEIANMESILIEARKEWEARKYIESWVQDDRVLE